MTALHGRRRRGFSLLEVLVTVTIFALLFSVMMAGWFQALQAQARLSDAALQMQQQQQVAFSLRQMLAELVSPRANRGVVFTGTRKGFLAESTASLAPGLGSAPLPVSLQVENQGGLLALRIEHPGQPGMLLPWRFQRAELRYLDAAGNAHDAWPPATTLADSGATEAPALPSLLQFTLQFDAQLQPMTLLVAPRNSAWQLNEPTSPFGTLAD
jgi:prepilin-type N-terminal cleavage/methylation domain-containing protein